MELETSSTVTSELILSVFVLFLLSYFSLFSFECLIHLFYSSRNHGNFTAFVKILLC